jgi:signal transduction histidine kinase
MDGTASVLQVLLIEDNPGDARLTVELLREAGTLPFEVAHATNLAGARTLLAERCFDVVLLDLSLDDADGIPMVAALCAAHPIPAVIVLTGLEDEATALAAIQRGAQDYLIKGQGDGHLIARAIRHAIERKRIADQLLEAKLVAEAASRAKSEFIANMSHELRTPLNAIMGFSEMIERGLGDEAMPKCQEYARYIRQSGSHLNDIINSILDLAKIEQGRYALHEEQLDLGGMIEFATRLVHDRVRNAGLTLRTRVPSRLPPLWADERLVKQALLNLLSNAVKFTPEGGLVQVTAGTADRHAIFVSVRDTGIGISPEHLARVGEPFLQIESAMSRRYPGTGLGLVLTKSIVELHGGRLDMSSRLGVGTQATLCFPSERSLPLPSPSRAAALHA